jgi:hypothetical protein
MKNTTYKILDAGQNLMGEGETKKQAISDAAKALGLKESQVEAQLGKGYVGEDDSLFLEELEA